MLSKTYKAFYSLCILLNYINDKIYGFGLVTIGEDSVVPAGVSVGKNTAISGVTRKEDYPNGILESGETITKAGDK